MKMVSMLKEEFLKGMVNKNGTINHFHYIDHSRMIGDQPTIETLEEFAKNHIKEWDEDLHAMIYPSVYTIRFSYYEDAQTEIPWCVDYFVFRNEEKALETFHSHVKELVLSRFSESGPMHRMIVLYPGVCSDLIAIPRPVPVLLGPDRVDTGEFQITDYIIFKNKDGILHIKRPNNGPSLNETPFKPFIF